MKNKKFKKLSGEEREKILMRILRNKTNGLLKVNEEVTLISVGARRKQFLIRVFNDINSFVESLNRTRDLDREIIYGDMAMKNLDGQKALIDTGIAVLVIANSRSTILVDQLLIYIPETRKCKRQCVCEKSVCKHIQSSDNNASCCGSQLVRA